MLREYLINILKKKDNRNNYIFTDEDRQRSADIKKAKHDLELKRIEVEKEKLRLQLERERLDFKAEFGNDNTAEILKPLMDIMVAWKAGAPNSKPTLTNAPASMPDEQIKKIISMQPKAYIKAAKKAPKDIVIKQIVDTQGVSEKDALRAYDIIMEEY